MGTNNTKFPFHFYTPNHSNTEVPVIDQVIDVDSLAERFIKTAQWSELRELLLRHAAKQLRAGRAAKLSSWFSVIPEPEKNHPTLIYWEGLAVITQAPEAAEIAFAKAHNLFGIDQLGRIMSAAGVLTAKFHSGNFNEALIWLAELATLDTFLIEQKDPQLEIWVLGCGNLLIHQDSHKALLCSWAKRAEYLIHRGSGSQVGLLASFLVQYRLFSGDISTLHALLDKLQRKSHSSHKAFQLTLTIWAAINQLTQAEYEAAADAIRQARKLARQLAGTGVQPLIWGLETYLALSVQDAKQAAKALQKTLSGNPYSSLAKCNFAWVLKYGCLLLENNLLQAQLTAETALIQMRQAGLQSHEMLAELALARVLIDTGCYSQAFMHLDNVDSGCRSPDRLLFSFISQMTRARGLILVNDLTAARRSLKNALTLEKMQNYVNPMPLFLPPTGLATLYGFGLEQGIAPDYIRSLIASQNIAPNADATEHWPWPVKIRTLGSFRIDIEARARASKNNKDNRPLQLIQLLIAINPDGVSRQNLADLLWPDADADAALHAFEVNLLRLRKLLGRPDAIILESGCLRLNRNLCWLDFWALDDISRQLDNGVGRYPDFSNRLLRIWRGAFLPHLDSAVVLTQRQTLKAKFVRTIERLGIELEKTAQYEKAIDCYRRAVEAEPLAESIYYRLIEVLNLCGRKAEALAAYRHFEVFYKTHVCSELPVAMSDLAKTLRNSPN